MGFALKVRLVIILFCFVLFRLNAQSHEVNAGFGFSYYYGDLSISNSHSSALNFVTEGQNWKNYRASYSIGYRLNFKKRFSLGLSYYHLNLAGYDSDNPINANLSDPSYFRFIRNLSFHTAVNLGYVDFRYEPFQVGNNPIVSPYFSLGLGMFHFNPKAFLNGVEYELQPLGTEGQGLSGHKPKYSRSEMCFPIGVGLKLNIPNSRLAIALDYTYSFTLSDYIDDVSTVYPDIMELTASLGSDQASLVNSLSNRNIYGSGGLLSYVTNPGEIRGNPKSKDNFATGQLKLIFYFNAIGGDSYYSIYRSNN